MSLDKEQIINSRLDELSQLAQNYEENKDHQLSVRTTLNMNIEITDAVFNLADLGVGAKKIIQALRLGKQRAVRI